jgi:hypothetical protein
VTGFGRDLGEPLSSLFFLFVVEKTDAGKSVIVVTPTRTEVQSLTLGIRSALKERMGQNTIEKEVFASVRFTEAEKMNLSNYLSRGDEAHFVHFLHSNNGFDKGTSWKVKEVSSDKALLINTRTEEEREFNPKEFLGNQVDVAEQKIIEIKEGEILLLQKNERVHIEKDITSKEEDIQRPQRKEFARFTNGESVKVKEIKNGEIFLEDGRKLAEEVKHLDYGYVSTSYSAQGKTCDHVIVAMTNLGGRALNQEQFYVSASRGRDGIDIFVEDKEYIQTRIEAMGNRVLNVELLPEKDQQKIKDIRGSSIEALKEASLALAEKTAKEIKGKKSLPEIIIEKVQDVGRLSIVPAFPFRVLDLFCTAILHLINSPCFVQHNSCCFDTHFAHYQRQRFECRRYLKDIFIFKLQKRGEL